MLVLHFRKFHLLHQKLLELYTFEVKMQDRWSIDGIHEASAHGRFATHAYALFQISEATRQRDSQERTNLELCQQEARRLGVGLIVMTEPRDINTWEELVTPQPNKPDPYMAEEMLNSLDPDSLEKIRDFWF